MSHKDLSSLAILGCVALLSLVQAFPALAAAVAPPLDTARPYAVLGLNSIATVGTVTCTNTGPGSHAPPPLLTPARTLTP